MKTSSFLYFMRFGIRSVLFKKQEPILGTVILTDKCNLSCKHSTGSTGIILRMSAGRRKR